MESLLVFRLKNRMRKIVVLALLFLLLPIAEMALIDVVSIKTSSIVQANPEDSHTIRILANGTIKPDTPNIWTNYSTYVLLGDLKVQAGIDEPAIIVERDNIVFDGNGYKLEGIDSYGSTGILIWNRKNVIIKNMEITKFYMGIRILDSSEISLIGNRITKNHRHGIYLECSESNLTDNSIIENYIAGNKEGSGIYAIGHEIYDPVPELLIPKGTRIIGNTIKGNDGGIFMERSANNNISLNRIDGNYNGVDLSYVNNTILTRNSIGGNTYGAVIMTSYDNGIIGNDITENNNVGIWLAGTLNISIRKTT
ncbi:right-handed parallel beta-helix repeat-containing protein [Candidatus Bathyarchaeota archaeon]|nr:right-handed parallel beta-helix repeat-containing protein [Candidatus Bathyarchaeota archaeon]